MQLNKRLPGVRGCSIARTGFVVCDFETLWFLDNSLCASSWLDDTKTRKAANPGSCRAPTTQTNSWSPVWTSIFSFSNFQAIKSIFLLTFSPSALDDWAVNTLFDDITLLASIHSKCALNLVIEKIFVFVTSASSLMIKHTSWSSSWSSSLDVVSASTGLGSFESPIGFIKRTVSDSHKQCRLWLCILKALYVDNFKRIRYLKCNY